MSAKQVFLGAVMSLVFHGIVARSSESTIRGLFDSLESGLPLRLVRLDDGVFGIYAKSQSDAPRELERIVAVVSKVTGIALYYWYDSRVGHWYQLFENGQMTRELHPFEPSCKSWGKGDPLEAVGLSASFHGVVEEAFLWDRPGPMANNRPEWEEAKKRFPIGCQVQGTVTEHLQFGGVFVELGDPVARGFIESPVTLANRNKVSKLFPPIGRSIQARVLDYSDERAKLVLLRIEPSDSSGNAEKGDSKNNVSAPTEN